MGEKVQLGSKVKDKITGFTGIVSGRAEYLYGTPHVWVEAPTTTDGKTPDQWIDESRVEVVPA